MCQEVNRQAGDAVGRCRKHRRLLLGSIEGACRSGVGREHFDSIRGDNACKYKHQHAQANLSYHMYNLYHPPATRPGWGILYLVIQDRGPMPSPRYAFKVQRQ
jgi:hypothetical protein